MIRQLPALLRERITASPLMWLAVAASVASGVSVLIAHFDVEGKVNLSDWFTAVVTLIIAFIFGVLIQRQDASKGVMRDVEIGLLREHRDLALSLYRKALDGFKSEYDVRDKETGRVTFREEFTNEVGILGSDLRKRFELIADQSIWKDRKQAVTQQMNELNTAVRGLHTIATGRIFDVDMKPNKLQQEMSAKMHDYDRELMITIQLIAQDK